MEDIRKKIKKEVDNQIEIDDSDIPVHERFVEEKHIKKLKKKNRL